MRQFVQKYWNKIDPRFRGIVLFVIVLLASNYFWELTVVGDEDETRIAVWFLGIDLSSFFRTAAFAFTRVTHDMLQALGVENLLSNDRIIFPNRHITHIVAGCTAVKQLFIALCILACSRGRWIHKLWYIPVALIILVGFNIFRLVVLSYITWRCREMFEVFHLYVMKYMYYGTILLLWLLWDERLRKL